MSINEFHVLLPEPGTINANGNAVNSARLCLQ